jgi:hypothetical protein
VRFRAPFISEGDALDMRTNKLTNAFIQGRMISLKTHQTRMNENTKQSTIKKIKHFMGLFNAIGNASEVNIENISREFEPILIDGEIIEKAYKLIRDMFILLTKDLF